MQTIFFILGKNPPLSAAEIFSVLKRKETSYTIVSLSNEVLILSFLEKPDCLELMKVLGGTIKIGVVLDEMKYEDDVSELDQMLSSENLSAKYIKILQRKVHVGISIYQAGGNSQYVAQLENRLKSLNLQVKSNLKKKGISVGFVQIKDRFLSSVSVSKNKLLTQGAEIVMFVTNDGILIGKTIAVQEFSSFSYRDFYRPGKDKKSGIMPPKLARMMINLSGVNKDGLLLDPFCGSGTFVTEAMFLGIKKIIGLDISDKAIADTNRNIDFIFNHFSELDKKYFDLSLRKTDVRKLDSIISSQSIDAIVTEPFLGPPLNSRPDKELIKKIFDQLAPLYLAAFAQFIKVLKKGGTIVMILPVFETSEGYEFMRIIEAIDKLGLKTEKVISSNYRDIFPRELSGRNSIIVGDKYSNLKREIIKFGK